MTDPAPQAQTAQSSSQTASAIDIGSEIIGDIEKAEAALAVLFPIIPSLSPYANILTAALNATRIVAADFGLETTSPAVQQAVVNTVTPGQSGASALN